MKKTRKIFTFALTAMLVTNMLGTTTVTASAANYSTKYSSYSTPSSSSDYAYWNGSKVVKSSNTTKSEIRWIQAAINYCIKYEGLSASYLNVDGSFGPASKNATIKFQKATGLTADGSFGPNTIKKMKTVLNDGKVTLKKSTSSATISKNIKLKNYLQVDQTWSSAKYGSGKKNSLRDSGCGILSIVNAVYNLTGNFIQPTTVAKWAHNKGLYNKYGSEGSYASVFQEAAKKYGSTYGFKYVSGGSGSASDTKLKNHIKNEGVAIVHVYNHYMTIVDYNSTTDKFLVFDSAPGSGTNWNSTNRKGLTSPNGDWKTAKQLSTGNLKIDRYYLYSKK